ncbi:MAG: hypothetical protein LW832_10710 [Parachlamydia sp.]|jgi:uncharacterized membrane protein|nr:hypothetical protein [Parachlamydia sp.]
MKIIAYLLALLPVMLLHSHEGHHATSGSGIVPFILFVGEFHRVLTHFPIALIIMTGIAELLYIWKKKVLFDNAARFILISAAIFTPITALLGFALAFGQVYEGIMNDIFAWHRYFGIVTTILVLWAVTLRENYQAGKTKSLRGYYLCLFFLIISLFLTALLGSSL